MNNEWLKNLKAGDKVIMTAKTFGSLVRVIDRVTATMVIFKGEYQDTKFRKKDGTQITECDPFWAISISQYTGE